MTRKICYISGTRADFGLMRSTLEAINCSTGLELDIIVSGMHLASQYGKTVRDIEAAGLPIIARIEVDVEPPTGANMASNIGKMLSEFVNVLLKNRPDIVLLLGDRGEMLAGALAAIHLNIPVAHIHGGERSGTVDEPIRHAISKLAHFHFTATAQAHDRLIRMGELPDRIWVTGAPGLDGIHSAAAMGRDTLLQNAGLDENRPVALMIYHPVLQEAHRAGDNAKQILDALRRQGVQIVALKPNSDAGSNEIQQVLKNYEDDTDVRIITHLPRNEFISWMSIADLMIGNSSAGIIEAASFGTQVINIGSRQNLRERNENVTDVSLSGTALESAIVRVLEQGRLTAKNVYGDGRAAHRIASLLKTVPLDSSVLEKSNAY